MDTTLPFSLAAMNCDESINTADVRTLGNISQTQTGARGESINLYQQRLPTMAERSHQTTKQANIIVIIKQPQSGSVRPGEARRRNFSFFVFAILNFTGDKIIRLWIGNFVIFSIIHQCWLQNRSSQKQFNIKRLLIFLRNNSGGGCAISKVQTHSLTIMAAHSSKKLVMVL